MYLVRHMRGMASELGLKQLFRLLSNTLRNAKQNPAKNPVGPKLEKE